MHFYIRTRNNHYLYPRKGKKMDKRQALSQDEALALVRQYKQVIRHLFDQEPRIMMFGSYSKGYANPDSDIDVAVIVPSYGD